MDYTLPAQSNETSYRELFGAISRQRWLMLSVLAVCVGISVLMIFLTEKQYVSSRQVVIEGRTQQFNTQVNSPLNGATYITQEDLPTQIEVLQSRVILAQVLAKIVSIDPSLQPSSPEDIVVDARQIAGTNAVDLQVFSTNQRLAQEVIEGIPQAFGDYVKNARRQSVQRAISNLSAELEAARRESVNAQNALVQFRSQNNLSPSDTEAAEVSQQVQRAEADLTEAKADLAGAQQNVRSLREQRKQIPPTILANQSDTPLAAEQQAREKLAQLEQQRDQLLIQYEKDAPQVREADAMIDAQKRYIARIPKTLENKSRITNPLIRTSDAAIVDATSRLASAEARLVQKQTYLSGLQDRLRKYNLIVPKLDELRRRVAESNVTLQQVKETYNNIAPLQDAVGEPIRVLSPATPAEQSRPNPPLYIAVGVVLGSLLAGIVALTRERMQDRVNTLDDAYRIAGAPTLGYVPPRMFGRNVKKTGKLPTRVMENYRIVRSNVLFSSREHPFRSLMVTSTGRGEGKSEVAANLAIAMASGGKRVLLVDAHIASPSLHERFSVPREPGLSEVVTGEADLMASIKSTEIENLYVLSAGERRVSLADGLGGGAMTRLHEAMIEAFDLVIFDTPPMLPRSDALTLSATVETVVYVVKPGETTKTLMKYCLELLRHAHARLLGVVFTNTEFYEEAA